MKRFFQSAISLSLVVLAAGTLTLLAPRAAHAVAAALVQVVNTTANPAIHQGINKQAGQQLDLACALAEPGTLTNCQAVFGNGIFSGSTYTVPANQTLVITAVDIQPFDGGNPSACASLTGVGLTTDNFTRKVWYTFGADTAHYSYPSGFLVGAGQTPGIAVPSGAPCPASAEMHGFLTAN